MSVLWASPGGYEAVLMASGFIFYRQVEEMIQVPFPTEGELAKAARQLRADKAVAEESSREESGC
ncbi:hypothetical protein ABZ912_05495 [Nonomuraea angiospora]|uniref:hypothetical protein n=1 Tax=Nonomuraea angiospora TaxID=46172 RepID=UPI0033E380A4